MMWERCDGTRHGARARASVRGRPGHADLGTRQAHTLNEQKQYCYCGGGA
jgi:hypothetical protein